MTSTDDKAAPPRRPRLIMLLPLFVFVALAAVFLIRLETGGNPDAIPSALIGRPAPDFDLPPLEGVARPGLARADLEGGVTVVNVFASWCGPCRIEHPQLMELAKDDGINLVAINYKDQPGNAAVSSPISAIRMPRSVSTPTAAPGSTGVCMACRKPSSSMRRGRSATSISARSARIRWPR